MDYQDELLEKEDGRYKAIDKVGTGLGSIPTEELLKKNVVFFGLPSGPALFLHLAYRAYVKIKDVEPLSLFNHSLFNHHDQGIWPDDHGRLFDFFEDFISHSVYSFTAIEAFANESIPENFQYVSVNRAGEEQIYEKDEIERKVNLDEKLDKILPTIYSVPSPKGKKVWEHYKEMKKVRDRIIHLKSIDQKPSGIEDETIWGNMLRIHDKPLCDFAYEVIGYFEPAISNRRWYKKYPYGKA